MTCPAGYKFTGDNWTCIKAAPQDTGCAGGGGGTCGPGGSGPWPSGRGLGNPIQPGAGAKLLHELDFTDGSGALDFARSYNSFGFQPPTHVPNPSAIPPILNDVWRTPYDSRLVNVGGTVYAYAMVRPDNTVKYFTTAGVEYPHLPGRPVETLTALGGGAYLFTGEDDHTETYDSSGRLTQLWDKKNLTRTLAYDASNRVVSVTDARGRVLSFAYTPGSGGWLEAW